MSITFSSCFYIIKSKFDPTIYIKWMNNFISIVNNFNLVIYTDENSVKYINTSENLKIQIILKPFEEFYNYKYKDYWISNHEKNILLNDVVDWKVNMLWSEKVWFVNETIQKQYFNTEFYGWCDIGYFRNRYMDSHTDSLINWPNEQIIQDLNINKIHYACINDNKLSTNHLYKLINNKNESGLPIVEIPANQNSIAGGFFIIHKTKIDEWSKTFDDKLYLYFKNNYLVKDDQIILADCIFSDLKNFFLHKENNNMYDKWFMFQRILSSL
jgi:hypothetical protein